MKYIIYLFLFIVITSALCCQVTLERQVINSSGANFEGTNFSLSYSVGEAIAGTVASPSVTLTQGFIQPVGQGIVSVDFEEYTLKITVYPNPAATALTLNITGAEGVDCSGFSASIVNTLGETVCSFRDIPPDNHTIDLSNYTSGVYFLIIRKMDITKRIKVVKI